jgi:iron-sulfur cluster repair protein YtfE (RIC family)
MLATKLLVKQHRKVEALFEKLEKSSSDPTELLTELANDLAAHMTIEQEIFYPEVKDVDHDQIYESYEEHALAEVALKRLLAADPEANEFKARVTALKELIEHHVKEEEEELFPEVEDKLETEKLEELGKQMEARFEQVVKAGYESAVPRGFAKTSSDVSKKVLKKPHGKAHGKKAA